MSPTPDYNQGYQDGYERGVSAGRSEARREIQALKAQLARRKPTKEQHA
jgi:flagellar biosynthesis/type III secretory pathway protein FliH